MFERFFPDEYVASTYVIPFEKLYEEGYRGVIFDIDNTLVPHGAPADERAKKLFVRLKEIGFQSCLISNNQKPRVEMFNEEIGTKYICNAHKPSTRNYIRAMELMGTDAGLDWKQTPEGLEIVYPSSASLKTAVGFKVVCD